MASAEHEPKTGLGRAPSGVQGHSPWSGGQGAKHPEAESILVIGCPTEPANLAPFQKCICISTLGATVMIWEKSRGVRGAHGYEREDLNVVCFCDHDTAQQC